MSDSVGTVRYALRSLRRSPSFAAAATTALALGLGAAMAVFALVDGVLLRPLPFPESERLVAVNHTAPGLGLEEAGQSLGSFLHYREGSGAFEGMALYHGAAVNLTGEGAPERVELGMVSNDFFRVLGVEAVVGRLLGPEDGRPGATTVVVLSHGLWRERYGGDPGIVGRTVRVNDRSRQVVGVAPPGLTLPGAETRLWMNLAPDRSAVAFSSHGGLFRSAVARLRPRLTPADAERDLARLVPSLAGRYGDVTRSELRRMGLRPRVVPLKEVVVGDVAAGLWIAVGAVGLLLLVAIANVGNLFLARAQDRRSVLVLRRVLGAAPAQLARGPVVEGLGVAALACALGAAGAWAGLEWLRAHPPEGLPRLHEVTLGLRTLAAGAVVAAACGSLLAWLSVRDSLGPGPEADPGTVLRGTGRGPRGGRPTGTRRRVLVASQVALAAMLLVGSTLMVESYRRLRAVDPGFEPEGVLTVEIALPFGRYPAFDDAVGFYEELLRRVRGLPGVTTAGAVSSLPLRGTPFSELRQPVLPEAPSGGLRPGSDGPVPPAEVKLVTTGYFEAMGIRTLARTRGETSALPRPAILSEPLARRLFPEEAGDLGVLITERRRVRLQDPEGAAGSPPLTVIGMVEGVHDAGVGAEPAAILYLPVTSRTDVSGLPFVPRLMSLAVRTSLPPEKMFPAVRRQVEAVDAELPVAHALPMERIVADASARPRLATFLLLVTAGAAVFLGAVGLYGLFAYGVSRRTPEIGVRMALGAAPGEVTRWVVRDAALLATAGIAAGFLAALGLTRFLRSLLYEVSATDPRAFAVAAGVLLGTTLLASWLPARRAAMVDPAAALRAE